MTIITEDVQLLLVARSVTIKEKVSAPDWSSIVPTMQQVA